jgi:hypothetical protein
VLIFPRQGSAVARGLAASLVLGALLACGPVQSTAFLIDADAQLEAARAAGAEKRAPYEWTAANLYLHKAREEVGKSEYDYAMQFAGKASAYASRARAAAVAAGKRGSGDEPAVRP